MIKRTDDQPAQLELESGVLPDDEDSRDGGIEFVRLPRFKSIRPKVNTFEGVRRWHPKNPDLHDEYE